MDRRPRGKTRATWEFYDRYAGLVWRAIEPIRRANHHDGSCCDRQAPYGASAATSSRWCAKNCDRIWAETLVLTERAFQRYARSGRQITNPGGWIRRTAVTKGHDAVQRLRVEAGVIAKPDRAVAQNQFLIDLLPELHLAVLKDLLYYVTSDDTPEVTAFPVRRLADRHGTSVTEMDSIIETIIEELERVRPRFAHENLTRPLSEKLAQHSSLLNEAA